MVKVTNVHGVVVPLTEAQARMVERLRVTHKHYEFMPAGVNTSAWRRVVNSLAKKCIVRRTDVGVELIAAFE